MEVRISRKDVLWGYIELIFRMCSGIFVLPFVLRMLSTEEVGYNYLMLTIGSIVTLFDFGFASMFSKNVAYIFGGAQQLQKEGVVVTKSNYVNYHLIGTMIEVAKMVYRRLSLCVLAIMLTIGTYYVYRVTEGFSLVENSLAIWIVYCLSTYFNIYFSYYNSLMIGRGLIMEVKKGNIASKITYMVCCVVFLYLGLGLMGLCLANIISPFVLRGICYYYFFCGNFAKKMKDEVITYKEKKDTFLIIWYNAKKQGITLVFSYAINKFGMFLAGLYLTLSEIASYGLMIQLGTIIITLATTYNVTMQPKYASLRVSDSNDEIVKLYSFSKILFLILSVIGSLLLAFIVPPLLTGLKSNSQLPTASVVLLYMMFCVLENNHMLGSTLIGTGNCIPWVKSAVLSGIGVIVLTFLLLNYTTLGIIALIIGQGIPQLFYNNWKWPFEAAKDLNTTQGHIYKEGFIQLKNRTIKLFKK